MWEAERQMEIAVKASQQQMIDHFIATLNSLKREQQYMVKYHADELTDPSMSDNNYHQGYHRGAKLAKELTIDSIQSHINFMEALKNQISAQLASLNGDFEEAV